MSVLIVTRSDDNDCVRRVTEELKKRGAEVVRLDTDLYPLEVRLTTNPQGPGRLTTQGETFYLDHVSALWYRRYFAGGRLPLELGEARDACVHEARRTLYGAIASLDCFQLDPLICVRKTDHKELQLKKAAQFGMAIPRTIFSNDPETVKQFYRSLNGRMITKMQSSFALYRDGQEQVVFTTEVTEENFAEIESLRYAPMIFQELIPKRFDIRSTVVGQRVFSAAIDSQKAKRTEVDWRRDGMGTLLEWVPFQLPSQTERALLRLTEEFGLNYAAADFVLTPDEELLFLEINAGGEWLWLAQHHGLPIDEALAEVLVGKAPRVPSWPWCRGELLAGGET